jgi:hypothetical protein
VLQNMVEPVGIEPTTSSLRSPRPRRPDTEEARIAPRGAVHAGLLAVPRPHLYTSDSTRNRQGSKGYDTSHDTRIPRAVMGAQTVVLSCPAARGMGGCGRLSLSGHPSFFFIILRAQAWQGNVNAIRNQSSEGNCAATRRGFRSHRTEPVTETEQSQFIRAYALRLLLRKREGASSNMARKGLPTESGQPN